MVKMGFLSLLLNTPFSLHHFPPSLNFEDFVVLLTMIALSPRLGVQMGFAVLLNLCTILHISALFFAHSAQTGC